MPSASLSGIAFHRTCRNASRSYAKIGGRVTTDPPPNLISLKSILATLKEAHAQDLLVLAPYQALSQPLPDLSFQQLEESLDGLRDTYEELHLRLTELISTVEAPATSNPDRSQLSTPTSSVLNHHNSFPVQSLPKFTGQFADWPNFYSRFNSIIDSSPALSVLQKYQHLIDALDINTQRLISHLSFKEEFYKVALDILVDEFSDPGRLSFFHAKEIIKLPPLNSKSPSDFVDFVDRLRLHFRALEAVPEVNELEAIVISLLLSKLDKETSLRFERYFNHLPNRGTVPSVDQLISFLRDQVRSTRGAAFHSLEGSRSHTSVRISSRAKTPLLATVPLDLHNCPICDKSNHTIYMCGVFKSKSPRERFTLVKSRRLCVNCLGNHSYQQCPSKGTCRQCKSPHHTLLHFGPVPNNKTSGVKPPATSKSVRPKPSSARSSPVRETTTPPPTSVPAIVASTAVHAKQRSLLLATTLVRVQTTPQNYLVLRAIIDTAAGASFISDHCVQTLKAKRWHSSVAVSGVGGPVTTAKGFCALDLATLSGTVLAPTHEFVILDTIKVTTPAVQIDASARQAASTLVLADPTFDRPSRVDCILGSDLAAFLFGRGQAVNLGVHMPVAIPTPFGYVLMGSAPVVHRSSSQLLDPPTETSLAVPALCSVTDQSLHSLVENFWRVEEAPPISHSLSLQDQSCEQLYRNTTIRDSLGRYQVRLPFINNDVALISNSYAMAYSRLQALERKFKANPVFRQKYVEFMEDLLIQGHMQLADGPTSYYIPHHGIFKSHGDTSQIRVVFDASAKTPSGTSLNNLLYSGPKLQPLLSDIISLFRQHPHVFTCDIRQMFRQINVHPQDRQYQCILWRPSFDVPVQTYYLNTVTYGVTSAPYLAIRTLSQLADDEGTEFPAAAEALRTNVYVDDIAVGSYSLESTLAIRDQLIALLARGGFSLRKWTANHPTLLEGIPADHLIVDSSNTSILGALWDPSADVFTLRLPGKPHSSKLLTKRLILSIIAQFFDPCGWLSPFVMSAKCFLQKLWTFPLDWDTPITEPLSAQWHSLINDFHILKDASIPRPFSITPTARFFLHGFCDASTAGYAAVLYLVPTDTVASPALLCSKTRVAPLKTLTVPRLELCGSHLLASLTSHYINLFSSLLTIESVHLWTDSQIVLHWVQLPPHKLKTFVANRVSQIQDWVPEASWHHVPSADNPADLASRGTTPSNLLYSSLWWRGPSWLLAPSRWPTFHLTAPDSSTLELATPQLCLHALNPVVCGLFDHISSWSSLLRVVRLILSWRPASRRCTPPALSTVVRSVCYCIQQAAFSADLAALNSGTPCSTRVQRLTPFLDSSGLIRVGGRLQYASRSPPSHPILLPKGHPLVNLLIDYYHVSLLHAGLTLTLSQLSLKFWILSARQAVRSRIFRCVTCFKAKPNHQIPMMGQLPAPRVTPSLPFSHTGLDFAGPFLVKATRLRKSPELKVYLCIFICFSTKAIHLELATDLSAAEFLDVLQRFICRRGCPAHIYSDCGTNFVGASAALSNALKSLKSDSQFHSLVERFCFLKGIQFHFNPPSAPHQGGLWERAIKSTKIHLSRLLGNQTPTYKVLNTIIIRIEGILNSRPLTPMSSDPNDLEALTPAHFLLGRSLLLPPEVEQAIVECTPRQLHFVNRTIQAFWARWKAEYLPSVCPRSKWTVMTPNLSIGDLVLIDEPHAPPLSWPLGRVSELCPGADGVVRKVRVTTANSQLVRPAHKLYKLPIY